MIVLEDVELNPNLNTGGWTINYEGNAMNFNHLNEAVEGLLELSLVIALNDYAKSKKIEWSAVTLSECMDAYRNMIMTWYQTQIPDPHKVTDLNKI